MDKKKFLRLEVRLCRRQCLSHPYHDRAVKHIFGIRGMFVLIDKILKCSTLKALITLFFENIKKFTVLLTNTNFDNKQFLLS